MKKEERERKRGREEERKREGEERERRVTERKREWPSATCHFKRPLENLSCCFLSFSFGKRI